MVTVRLIVHYSLDWKSWGAEEARTRGWKPGCLKGCGMGKLRRENQCCAFVWFGLKNCLVWFVEWFGLVLIWFGLKNDLVLVEEEACVFPVPGPEREFFSDNLLVRIHHIT